jgi:putative ABC transport system permease protein
MIRNYLKIAFRSLGRSKIHSAINVIGLGLGIACCILIVLFVKDEWTFDGFHAKAERIFRVYVKEDWGVNQQFFNTTTPFPMGPALKENFPEVEAQVRIVKTTTQVRIGDQLFSETLTVADRDLFTVFDFEVVKGDRISALERQNNIILSTWMAEKYFGDADPINKIISIQMGEEFADFTVSGITSIPTNSSIQFYLLISDLNLPRLYNERTLTSAWFNINPETYILLREGAEATVVESKFPSVFKPIIGEQQYNESKYAPGLQPLTGIHLDTSYPAGMAPVSNPKYSYILAAIALLILLVACINFVTLSIGRSLKRAREVGIRKVVGAQRRQLITQFIGEAVIVTSIALALGLILAVVDLPLFNDLSGKELVFPVNGFMITVVGCLLIIIGLIAGSYPAFVLSSFRPATILKGAIQGSNRQSLRKVLVGVQLVLSIFLISSTLIMRDQFYYLQTKDLGFNKEQLVVVQLNVPRARMSERVATGFEKAEQFKSELAGLSGITAVSASSHDFGRGAWANMGYTDNEGTYRTFDFNSVDDDYFPMMKMQLLSGRNFSDDNPSDKRRAVVVNEAFAKEYGWTDPIGKKIPGKGFPDHEIIGMVKDFNYNSLYTRVTPLAIVQDPSILLQGSENMNIDNSPVPKLLIRLKPENMQATLDQVKAVWNKLTGGQQFVFSYIDQALADQYRNDQNLGKIISIATLLAMIIGSLGLYGLASLAMQNRTKEISIRKVLGATEQSLLLLLSREYLILIAICLVLSVPFTIYLMQTWLASFEYHISVGFETFLLAGSISLVIALATISYQTFKTAWTQPAHTLKYE